MLASWNERGGGGCRETWRIWVYVAVLIAFIILFNIAFNVLLYALGRECSPAHTLCSPNLTQD